MKKMIIMVNALKERVRRKELYIIVAIGILILLLCCSGSATISISGENITGFKSMFGVVHVIMNAIGCILAVVLSLKTIPNEYERKTSHLVWIRGISQVRYHTELTLANIASAIIASAILYGALGIYVITNGEFACLIRMVPAFFIVCINVAVISLMTSILSIKLPSMASGLIALIVTLCGIFYGVLDIYRNMIGGFSGKALKLLLWIIPDFNGVQTQAQNLLMGQSINIHIILTVLLTGYIISLGIIILKIKEA